jgi:2-alkenal reductase
LRGEHHLGVEGLVILHTVAGSPAARPGLRGVDLNSGPLGDAIVSASGKPLRRLADLIDRIESVGVDHTISLTLQRGASTTTIDVPIIDIGQSH